jgi:molecular chaperone HtpG
MSTETYSFQAEINQLMSLIINTFYSNKDIYLRELISNASDAIDKARYNSLQSESIVKDYYIKLIADKEKQTLSIEDNGIGFSKQDMIDCLGTIANSGTKQFMQALKEGTDVSLIGQFGVGFYSAYLVADTVSVYSGNCCWESKAGGSFTIEESETPFIENGTKLVLHMKEDCLDYLEQNKIEEIVHKHSEYINYPIQLWITRTETKQVPDDSEDVSNENDKDNEGENEDEDVSEEGKIEDVSEEGKIEDVSENEEHKSPKMKTVEEEIQEWKQINVQKPLWMRKPEDVDEEEHASFYKSLTNDWDSYLAHKHFSAEGQIEFKSLLYIPKRAPFDMFSNKKKKNNIKLYVKRVFIMDNCEELIPEWLNFVSGVVDSEDLPLNISREILQQNKIINVIKKNLVKKCIELFNDLMEKEDTSLYKTFYDNYHQSLKLGVHEDNTNRDKLIKLLMFETNKHTSKIPLSQYVKEMKSDQEHIYFITGESRKAVENSPFVKGIINKGFDVLFFVDPIDEYMVQQVREFEDKKLLNISKDNALFQEKNDDLENHICKVLKQNLNIEKVVVSTRLGEEPCCLVSSEYGWSANMERIMKAQTLQNNMQMGMMQGSKKILEINPNHKMIQKLQQGIKNTSLSEKAIQDIASLIFDTALISSGFTHEDPSLFSKRIFNMITMGLDADVNDDENIETKTDDKDNDSESKEESKKIENENESTPEESMEEID